MQHASGDDDDGGDTSPTVSNEESNACSRMQQEESKDEEPSGAPPQPSSSSNDDPQETGLVAASGNRSSSSTSSSASRPSGVARRVERSPSSAVPRVLREVVQQEPEHTKFWHKELLFGLFVRSDVDQLRALAKQTGGPSLTECSRRNKRRKRKRFLNPRKKPEKPSQRPRKKHQSGSHARSELPIVPYVLRPLKRGDSPSRTTTRGVGILRVPEKWKRREVASRTLDELEKEVYSRFKTSKLGSEALSRPSSYHAPHARTGAGSLQRQYRQRTKILNEVGGGERQCAEFAPLTIVYNESSLAAVSKWAERGELTKEQAEDEERIRTMDSTPYQLPVPSPFSRLCSVCKKWGHYEVECQEITNSSMIKLSNKINVQKTLRGFVEEKNEAATSGRAQGSEKTSVSSRGTKARAKHSSGESDDDEADDDDEYLTKSTACEFCGSGFNSENLLLCDGCDCLFHIQCLDPPLDSIPEGDWFCSKCEAYNSDVSSVVEIEGCDGFVIEQRKVASSEGDGVSRKESRNEVGLGFPDCGWETVVGLVRRERLPPLMLNNGSRTGEASPSADVIVKNKNEEKNPRETLLSEGELCWAKRSSAAEGQPGRDEWWPSIVVKVSDGTSDRRTRRPELTPYVVKMYAAMGASRVRASSVLPFFQHYEELGYNRLHGRESKTGVDMSLFRTALEEATYEMGCKSLLKALIKSREICGTTVKADETVGHHETSNGVQDEWNDAEETEEDGFIIRSRKDSSVVPSATSVDAKTREESSSATPLSVAVNEKGSKKNGLLKNEASPTSRVLGSVVAWNAHNKSISKAMRVQYGIVMHICPTSGKALVRPMPELERIMVSSRTVTDTRSMWRPPIQSCPVAASLWLRTERLHVICESPTPEIMSKFLKDVDSRLKEEMDHLLAQKAARRPKGRRIKVVTLPKEVDSSPDTDGVVTQKKPPALKSNPKQKKSTADRSVAVGTTLPPTESRKRKYANKPNDCGVSDSHKEDFLQESEVLTNDNNVSFTLPKGRHVKPETRQVTAIKGPRTKTSGLSPSETTTSKVSGDPSCSEVVTLQASTDTTRTESGVALAALSCNVARAHLTLTAEDTVLDPDDPTSTASGETNEQKRTSDEGTLQAARIETGRGEPGPSQGVAKALSVKPESLNDSKLPLTPDAKQSDEHQAATTTSSAAPLNAAAIKSTSDAHQRKEYPDNTTELHQGNASDEYRGMLDNSENREGSKTALIPPPKTTDTSKNKADKFDTRTTDSDCQTSSLGASGQEDSTTAHLSNVSAPEKMNDGTDSSVQQPQSLEREGSTCDKEESSHDKALKQTEEVALKPPSRIDGERQSKMKSTAETKVGDPPPRSAGSMADTEPHPPPKSSRRKKGGALADGSVSSQTRSARKRSESASNHDMNGKKMETSSKASSVERIGRSKGKKKRLPSRSGKRTEDTKTPTPSSVHASASKKGDEALSSDTKLTQQLFGDDVYQAERILEERKVKGVPEYLIKWKGFSSKECTWEPERNILNKNFLRMYQIDKMDASLKKTAEAKQKGSVTSDVLGALARGRDLLAKGYPLGRNRLCPFCGKVFREPQKYLRHMRSHKGEENHDLIMDVAKLAREDWFEKKEGGCG